MKMQKFEADSMPEALHKVKAALGPDAIIMDTRSTRKPGKLGLRARDRVQVWAAQSLEDAGLKPAGLGAAPGVVGYAPAAEGHLDTGLLTALHARLGDLESKLDLLATAAAYGSGSWARGYTAAELSDEQRAAGLAALARRVAVSGEIALASARVVALVGPTGAGKTLTAAKLAGRFALTHGARVGVICADGFRVGGMTEMQGYCDLLGVPMAQARDEQEMRAAIASHGECDLILIDTPGVSPRSDQQLAELRRLLEAAAADEVHLVLSAAASHGACVQALAGFGRAGASHLLFTRLDESPEPAQALAAAVGSGKAISYLADGQNVPQDLRPADEAYLVAALTQDLGCTA